MAVTSPKHRFAAGLIACLGLICRMSDAVADEGDVFNFLAAQNLTHDSNVFRLAPTVDPNAVIGRSDKDDFSTVTTVGILADKRIGRQRLFGDATRTLVRYRRFDFLNYDVNAYRLNWDGEIGNDWQIKGRWSRDKALTSFGDFRSPTRNLETRRPRSLFVNYRVDSRWWLLAGVSASETSNSTAARRSLDAKSVTHEGGIQYRAPWGGVLGLTLRNRDGSYPNRAIGPFATADTRFEQEETELTFTHPYDGLSRVEARLAHVRRSYPNLSARDFSGPSARLAWTWVLRGGWSVTTTARRELVADEQLFSSYDVTKALSVAPRWVISGKTQIEASFERRLRYFLGDPGFFALPVAIPVRRDATNLYSASIVYAPLRSTTLRLSLSQDERVSSADGLAYQATTLFGSAQVVF